MPVPAQCYPLSSDVRVSRDGFFEYEGVEYETYIPATWGRKGYEYVHLQLPNGKEIIGLLEGED